MLFVDAGPFGRFPSLQPVTWVDDWPMVGVDGKAVVTYKKPNVGKRFPVTTMPTSDEFTAAHLGMQWGWNHNPDPAKWSLTQRHGYLRLTTGSVVTTLRNARNTLTQRPFSYYDRSIPTMASTKVDVAHMKDGDIAGLAIFQDPYAFIAVKQENGSKQVIMVKDSATIATVPMNGTTVYLRTIASNTTRKATFEYSFDNAAFTGLGDALATRFSLKIFTGIKFCLFNYATKEQGGYADFDWFRTGAAPVPSAGNENTINKYHDIHTN
jgi:beta-xylosidase